MDLPGLRVIQITQAMETMATTVMVIRETCLAILRLRLFLQILVILLRLVILLVPRGLLTR
jgi:hypothetical protein